MRRILSAKGADAMYGSLKPVRETSPAGPRLEALPSLRTSNLAFGLNIVSLLLNVTLTLVVGLTIMHAVLIVLPLLWIWFLCKPSRRTLIKERNETRARNLQAVVDHWDSVDMLELVPPSVGLAELDAQLEALGKMPPLDESNRARKRRLRREAQPPAPRWCARRQEAEALKRKIIESHAVPFAQMGDPYHQRAQLEAIAGRRPVIVEHDYHCDDPAGPCTCSDNAPNCRCTTCDNRSLDWHDDGV